MCDVMLSVRDQLLQHESKRDCNTMFFRHLLLPAALEAGYHACRVCPKIPAPQFVLCRQNGFFV